MRMSRERVERVWVRESRVDYRLRNWVAVYQRKDWINSDSKAAKPHNHEENPEDGRRVRNEKGERKDEQDV